VAHDSALDAIGAGAVQALVDGPKRDEAARKPDRALMAQLARLIGKGSVVADPRDTARYAYDQCWLSIAAVAAGAPLSRPDAIVRPKTVEDVRKVLAFAHRERLPVTPWGGGSGVQGAAVADRGGIVLDLRSFSRVLRVDESSYLCEVEAGMNGALFERALNRKGLTFPHYPASIHLATVGGYVAARGSGVLSTRYGKIEDLVLALDVVLADGTRVKTAALPRHAVGPELTQLFVGSEGTLGVVVGATVKIRPLPKSRAFATFAFEDVKAGIEAGRRIMTTGLRPAAMRLYDESSASLGLEKVVRMGLADPTLVLTFEGDHRELVELESALAEEICLATGGADLGPVPAERWWEKRYDFYYPPHAPTLPSIWGTLDVVMDFAHAAKVYAAMRKALVKPFAKCGLVLTPHFSHWYEWGTMLYARFKVPKGPERYEDALALHDAIFRAGLEAALDAGALLNDHHGVGVRLAPYLDRACGEAWGLARRIKRALDPAGILCPGKLALEEPTPAKKAVRRPRRASRR
jgi:alkyldihydroxyacetonephosphate synthase